MSTLNWFDELEELSIAVALSPEATTMQPLLVMSTSRVEPASAWDTGVLLQALHDATGRVGHVLASHQGIRTPRRNKLDRQRANLFPLGMSGGSVLLGFPHSEPDGNMFDITGELSTLSEEAVKGLLSCLPSTDAEDDQQISNLVSRSPAIQTAVDDIVRAVASTSKDVSFSLRTRDLQDVRGELSPAQATLIHSTLKAARTDKTTVRKIGLLDGLRSSKLSFFMISEGRNITGTLDERDLPRLKELLSADPRVKQTRVDAVLEQTSITTVDGRRLRPSYKLLEIRSTQPEAKLDFGDSE